MKLFNNLKIGPKIIFVSVTLTALLVIMILILSSMKMMDYIEYEAENESVSAVNTLNYEIENLKNQAKNISFAIANNNNIIKAVKDKDRNSIIKNILDMKNVLDIEFATITDENGNVIARIHEPDKFGDNITNQYNIQQAMKNNIASVVETGSVVKLSVRSGTPIKDNDNKIIGIVSTGYRLDQPQLVDRLKRFVGNDFTIFLDDVRISTTVMDEGVRKTGTKASENVVNTVLKNGKDYKGKADIIGKPYITYYIPLKGFEDKTIGMLFSGVPMEKAYEERNSLLFVNIIISIIAIIIYIIIVYYVIKSIVVKPINQNVELSKKMSEGNFNFKIELDRNDEFGVLANSMKNLSDSFKSMIDDVNSIAIAASEGKLDKRTMAKNYKGDIAALMNSFNNALDSIIKPLNIAAEYVDKISKGEIPKKITDEYKGDFNEIKNNLNQCIDAINLLVHDTKFLYNVTMEGKLTTRANTALHFGEYKRIIEEVNFTLDRLVSLIDNMPIPVQIIDKERNVLYLNRHAGNLLK